MNKLLLLLLFLIKCVININTLDIISLDDFKIAETKDVLWTWHCVDDKGCQKISVDNVCTKDNCQDNKTMVKSIISEQVCNLLCPPGNLWPQPNGDLHISPNYVSINTNDLMLNVHPKYIRSVKTENNPNTEFNITKAAEKFIQKFQQLGGNNMKNAENILRGLMLNLVIMSPIYKFENGVDESYTLLIGQTTNKMMNVTVIGNTFPGVRHGLETLSQLLIIDPLTGNIVAPSEVKITDKPKYSHRGIALDTSRNYITVETILRTLDAMASVKLNTLHWHITDSQSFPFVSKSNPLFSKYGAYSPEKVYTEEDILLLVDYARLLGIRIVPELDLPAHVGEGWQAAPGAVVCFNAQPWTEYCVEPPCGQVDPTSNIVYDVLKGLYTDLNRAFDSDMFHMGGDEVNLRCWNSTENIVNNMEKLGLKRNKEGFHELWSNFQSKAKDILQLNGGKDKQLVLWTSSLTEGDLEKYLNNTDYIIQIWTTGTDSTIKNLLKKKFKIILSNYDSLYFDCGFGAWVGTGNNWCSPYIPWQKVYENTPEKLIKLLDLDKDYEKYILGSEAALWTEQADDSSIDNRLWPRGAALAESLWSPGGSWKTAEKRYLLQRERFVRRGIAADTVQPEWCRQNQGFCYL